LREVILPAAVVLTISMPLATLMEFIALANHYTKRVERDILAMMTLTIL